MNQVLVLVIGLLGTTSGALAAYIISKRTNSGRPSTAPAEVLFDAGEHLREEQRQQISELRSTLERQQQQIDGLRQEAVYKQKEIEHLHEELLAVTKERSRLRVEILQYRKEVDALRVELAQYKTEAGMLRGQSERNAERLSLLQQEVEILRGLSTGSIKQRDGE